MKPLLSSNVAIRRKNLSLCTVMRLVKIKNIDLHCVQYFLEQILPDMIEEGIRSPFDIRKITEEALAQ